MLLLLAAAAAIPASAVAAAEPHWSVRVSASGSYVLDYGSEGDAIDGSAGGVWSWQLRAVASGADVDTDVATFRMEVEEGSSIVAGGAPSCRPPQTGAIGPVRDRRAGLHFERRRRGFQVDHPYFGLLGGCHVGAHGMTLYDGAKPSLARVPRGAFRPKRARSFERTWTQQIALDLTHQSGPPHSFSATGGLTVRLRRISARAARALEARLRAVPRAPR